MPEHRRRRATKRSAATPIGPKGCGAMAPDSRRRDDGDVSPSLRSGNNEDGAMAPQQTTLGAPAGPRGARSRT